MPDMVTDREGDHSGQIDADFVSHYRVSGKRRSGKRGLQIHFDWMSAWGVDYFLCRDNLPQDYDPEFVKEGAHVSISGARLSTSHLES